MTGARLPLSAPEYVTNEPNCRRNFRNSRDTAIMLKVLRVSLQRDTRATTRNRIIAGIQRSSPDQKFIGMEFVLPGLDRVPSSFSKFIRDFFARGKSLLLSEERRGLGRLS